MENWENKLKIIRREIIRRDNKERIIKENNKERKEELRLILKGVKGINAGVSSENKLSLIGR
jgi:hypothetical protein